MWITTDSESSEGEPATEKNVEMLPYIRLLFTFLLFWQFAYKVSNNAMQCLLRFLKYVLLVIGNAFHCHQVMESVQQFPVTLNNLYKQMLIESEHLSVSLTILHTLICHALCHGKIGMGVCL